MACTQAKGKFDSIALIHPHDLAKNLHSNGEYVLLDCRPVLAYNSCHISGAVNVNFTGLMKKRFIAGKIGLADLVTTEEGRDRFRKSDASPTVVYDEDTNDVQTLSSSNSMSLVVTALANMGRDMYVLQGGLNAFGNLHPSLCEVAVPNVQSRASLPPPPRASTPGMRDQALDWHTAPPVTVLSYLVLGSEKDAKSKLVFDWFNINYVLNVTPSCPNLFENSGVVYKRIPVSDTGTQKLSNKFTEAFEYLEEVRKNNGVVLVHCMAGISRSVTLTIAYLMAHFGMSMQDAYQYVKDKRPAISPNLNFMGQLVEFERELTKTPPPVKLDIQRYCTTEEQKAMSEKLMEKIIRTNSLSTFPSFDSPQGRTDDVVDSTSTGGTTVGNSQTPFILKPLASSKGRRAKKLRESLEVPENIHIAVGDPPICDLSSELSSLNVSKEHSSTQHTETGLKVVGEQLNLHDRSTSPNEQSSLSSSTAATTLTS